MFDGKLEERKEENQLMRSHNEVETAFNITRKTELNNNTSGEL